MKLSDFDFDLPTELIAQYPTQKRTASRMLVIQSDLSSPCRDAQFEQFCDYIKPNDLLVFNNTKVIAARLFGHKQSGGKVEVMLERVLSEKRFLAKIKSSKSPKTGARLMLGDDHPNLSGFEVELCGREDDLFELSIDDPAKDVFTLLEDYGHIPLPPYLKRHEKDSDLDRYQTVYAKQQGAVAAPTAGLHFDQDYLKKIKQMGVQTAFITLHVGSGTYQPVRNEDIRTHKMHSELIEMEASTAQQIIETKKAGGRVIAIGTTSLRCLESVAQKYNSLGELQAYRGETDIFIYPGYQFQLTDALLTNFHLPQSTLFMLICALGGQQTIHQAYQHAIEQRYRFYSYGDCMLIFPSSKQET